MVALTLDEMGIKKGFQLLPNGVVRGYVDCGMSLSDDTLPLAKDALVLVYVSLYKGWKIPIGYFMVMVLNDHFGNLMSLTGEPSF